MADTVKPTPMGSVPVPDPTRLTTEALTREIEAARTTAEKDIKALRELLESHIKAAREFSAEQFRLANIATDKSEAAFGKQFSATQTQIEDVKNTTQLQLGDVKDRLTKIEAIKLGATEHKQGADQTWALVLGVGGVLISVAAVIVVLMKP